MAPPSLDQFAADDAAYAQQMQAQRAKEAAEEQQKNVPQSYVDRFSQVGHTTLSMLDSAMTEAEKWGEAGVRLGRDAIAGGATGVANTGDALNTANVLNEGMEALGGKGTPLAVKFDMPLWDHARKAIMDFRDAAAVKDPNLVDNLTQSVAQLATPFMGYSRMLSGIHGFANVLTAGALTDATALQPHDARMADALALGRTTEGKFGEVLNKIAPDGSLLNRYIDYLHDRSDETAAEGRWKNVVDGAAVNSIATPLLHAIGPILKQGTAGLRYLVDNGVGSVSEMGGPAMQRGAVGDLSQPRPPLRQNYDPAEGLLEQQVRRDADAADAIRGTPADAPGGRPSRAGVDSAQPLFDAQARADAAAAAKAQGQVVYHGTPYDFDHFDLSQIGTGEGNQTFGHGLYFAENPKTAGHYQNMLVPQNGALGAAMTDAQKAVKAAGGRAQAYAQLSQQFAREKDPVVRQQLQQQMSLIRSGNYARGQGTLVHAEIANEHLDSMMHWDQSIQEQPQLQKLISNLDVKIVPEGNNFRVTLNGKPGGLFADEEAAKAATFHLRGAGRSGEWNGGALYDGLATVLGSQQAASQFLSRRGIHGIKFLDQGSRDAGEGTHNIVLFNDKHAKVVKKERAGA